MDSIPERLREIERLRAIVAGLARNATDDDDEGDPAVVYEPIRSGYVLIRRDHLVNVTSLEHERWTRAHPSSAGRWEPHRARPGSVTDCPGYRLAIHRTASCAVTVADASAAQRREHGAGSAETMG